MCVDPDMQKSLSPSPPKFIPAVEAASGRFQSPRVAMARSYYLPLIPTLHAGLYVIHLCVRKHHQILGLSSIMQMCNPPLPLQPSKPQMVF